MDREHLFRQKVLGELNADEEAELALLFEKEPDALLEFEEFRLVMISVLEGEREEVKDFLASLEEPVVRKIPFQWYAIAASIALVLTLSFFFFRPSAAPNLYESYLDTYPNTYLPVTRDASGIDSLLYTGFLNYEAGQYAEAYQSLSAFVEKDSSQGELYFFMALSLVELDSLGQAEELLDQLYALPRKAYQREVAWYRSLVKLQLEKVDEAREGLEQLLVTPGTFKKEEVERLLREIR